MLFLIYSNLQGSPFVPTKEKEIEYILRQARLRKGQKFIDLGCGDGRVVRLAAGVHGLKSYGIDINPLLILYARIVTSLKKIENAKFERKSIWDTSLENIDVIYLFLMPELLSKMVPFIEKQMSHKLLIISHGFKIPIWNTYLVKTIAHSPFPTYFYQIEKKI